MGDHDRLQAHFSKHYSVALAKKDLCLSGWSWGSYELTERQMRLHIDGALGFEFPLKELSQVTSGSGRAPDLVLEFHGTGEAEAGEEMIHEMRLQLPQGQEPSVEDLCTELREKTGATAAGEAITLIPDIPVVAPRGRHDLEFFAEAVKIRGKTQTYTVQYRTVARLFLLQRPEEDLVDFVIGLSQPIRAGTTSCWWLVLSIDKSRELAPIINLPNETLDKFGLKSGVPQQVYGTVVRLFQHLSGKAVVAPTKDFDSPNKASCVRCCFKTNPGYLPYEEVVALHHQTHPVDPL